MPVINKIYKPVPQEKIVDVYKEVVIEKIVEIPEEEIVPLDVQLNTVVGKVKVNERRQNLLLNTRVRKSHLNKRQVQEFEASSRQLADVTAENEAIKAQIQSLEQTLQITNPERIVSAQGEQQQLTQEIRRLRELLAAQTRERDTLRAENSRPQEVELQENIDSTPVDQLLRDIELVKSKNQQLREFLDTTRQVTQKNAVARSTAYAGSGTTTTNVRNSQVRVSTQPLVSQVRTSQPIRTSQVRVAQPVTTTYTNAPVTTTTYTNAPVTTTYTNAPVTTSYVAQGAPVRSSVVRSYNTPAVGTTYTTGTTYAPTTYTTSNQVYTTANGPVYTTGVRESYNNTRYIQ